MEPRHQPLNRIHLSVPHMSGRELRHVADAFASNWLSTVGPHLPAFEEAFRNKIGLPCVALSSGTAALHLGLKVLGVGPGDEVVCQSLTFAASANPIVYLGARPVFLDSEPRTWNLDPQLLAEFLAERGKIGKLPRAVVVVHLFGQCAEMDDILEICGRWGVPVVEDAAESLGATHRGRPAGSLGEVAAFSFNGNKIITTTGGGMLATRTEAQAEKVRFWATQARDPGLAYSHSEIGYNYRLSNVLAGIGRGQLEVLEDRVARRREIAFRYAAAFADLDGIELMPQAPRGLHTNWLSCFVIDPARFGASRDDLIRTLDAAGIESRPVWKPMHLQPVFDRFEHRSGSVAESLFRNGICLPSSSSLAEEDQARVVEAVRGCAEGRAAFQTDIGFEAIQSVPSPFDFIRLFERLAERSRENAA